MQKVVSISLNGIAYQLEEPGYEELRAYLQRAESRLHDSPDRAEVMADLEQAIGEKCSRVLGPHKTVVSAAEITGVLQEMGPVETAEEKPADSTFQAAADVPHAQGSTPLRKRLFKIREGQMWCGVCNGLAAYLGVDVTWVRIAAVVLTLLTTGFWLLVYFGLVFIVPYADTSEDRAMAFGAPFSTEEFLGRAKKKSEEFGDPEKWRREWRRQQQHWNRQFQHMNEQVRQATAQAVPQMSNAARAASAIFVPIAGILGAVLFVGFVLGMIELLAVHTLFGWEFPHAFPLWVSIVALALVYAVASMLVRSIRYSASGNYAHHAGWGALHTVVWTCTALLLLWLAYTFAPGVREIADQLFWATSLTIDNISDTTLAIDFDLRDIV